MYGTHAGLINTLFQYFFRPHGGPEAKRPNLAQSVSSAVGGLFTLLEDELP